jgi:hypothetical protein
MLPPAGNQQETVRDIVYRLEERYLREMKTEEAMRFAEIPSEDLMEEQFEATLDMNQRFKKNELGRNYLAQNVSDRR